MALCATGKSTQVGAERYDLSIADIVSIQDETSEFVAPTLSGQVQKIDAEHAKAKKTDNHTADECLLREPDLQNSGNFPLFLFCETCGPQLDCNENTGKGERTQIESCKTMKGSTMKIYQYQRFKWCPGAESNHRHEDFQFS